jgi:hypothetical protein
MGGVDAEELMQKYIEMGMPLVLTGSDRGFFDGGCGAAGGPRARMGCGALSERGTLLSF